MAKKKSTSMTYGQYKQQNTDPNKGSVSFSDYKKYEEQQKAAQQVRANQQKVKDLAAQMAIQKARDKINPIMNNTGMGQAENARNSFGIGKTWSVKDNQSVVAKESTPDKRGYIEWLRKLDKTKKDKEAGVKTQPKVTPIVQRKPEEIKTEFMTQKYNQLQEALADRALGFEAVEDSRKKNNTGNNWTLQQQMGIYGDRKKYQAEGMYGDSGLPWYMNDEQRKALREESAKTAQEKRDLAKQYEQFNQDAALGGIYDVMYNRDTANERAILNNPAYKGTDFESNAQATLAGLESEYAQNRRYSQDQARRLLEEGIDLNAETPVEKEKLRQQVYDSVMQDTYKERIQGMSYEDKKAMDDELDKAIAGMAAPWGADRTQADAIDSLNREAEAYDAQVKAIDSAQTYYDFIQNKRQFAADSWMGDVSSSYDPSLLPEVKMYSDEYWGNVPEPQGTEVEKAYYWANNWQNLGKYADSIENANKYMFLAADPEILDMFNKFYAKDKAMGYRGSLGTNTAQQFLDGLEPYLDTMLVEYQNNVIQSKAQDPLAGGFIRVMSPALQTVGGLTGTIAAVTGQDIDSKLYLPSRVVAQTRSRQNEDIGKLADQAFGEFGGNATRFMLGVVDSVADNVFAMNLGTGLAGDNTKKAMRLVQMIMSGSATSNKMVEMLENGTEPTEAALYAIGDGVIEWLTEKYSLEQIMGPDVKQLYGNGKEVASHLLRSFAAEGSEEINSGLLNMGLDYVLSMVYGHENELKQKYNELVAGGMSDEEASRKVLEDKLAELGTEGLAGAISGFAMAGSRYINVAADSQRTGKKIKGKKSGTDVMMDLARGMAEGTDSRTLADQLAAEIEKGNEVSNYDLGRLANLTALEVGEQRSQVIKDTITNNVIQQLKDKGVSEEQAQQFAAIISKNIFTGAKLTRAEISTLGQDERAIQLWKDFNTMSAASLNLAMAVKTETKPLDSIANKMGELVSDTVKASSAAAAEIEKSISETESMEEAIDNLQARRSGLLSEQYANLAKEYLQNNPEAKENKAYLDDVMKIRLAAMTLDTMPETSLEAEQAKKLYTAAREEFNQIDEERIKNQRPAMEGQGVTTYNGAEYGTEAWKAATEGLSKTTKNVMGAVGEIAARFGYRVNMVNDSDNPDVYGFEDADTGAITINVANGLKHHMLVTMAHEMTHWLEQNSRQGYDDLRSFVLQSLRAQGENIQDRIVKIMDNYNMVMGEKAGAGMTINGAMLELVAQSSEGLLSSKRAAQELQNVNPDLFSKVKSFVRNVVARINAAIKGMDYEGSLSKEARELEKYREQLADIWFNGRRSAMPGEPTEAQSPATETAAEGEKSYSVAQRDQAYMQAVESGNTEEQQKIIDQAAKEAGYTYKAYHGTNRGDRVGNVFLPERATSGPMAYFTSNRDIAQNYANDKADTSIAYDNDYHDEEYEDYDYQFKIKDENGKMVPVRTLWDKLSFAQKRAIKEKAGHVTLDDEGYEVIYDEEATGGPGGFDEYTIREHRGNIIEALTDVWLKSGFLLGQEEEFINVLKLAGIPNEVTWFNPDVSYEKVYDTWLKISNPFRTDALYNEKFLDDLETWWNEQDQSKYANNGPANSLYAFDKFSISVDNWIAEAREDIKSGDSNSWTRIPDAVTDYLKSKGYDGIIDAGGKRGGIGHTVYIPFTSEQVKSAEPVVYDDNGDVIPPSERFNEEHTDIRYSIAQGPDMDVDTFMMGLNEFNLPTYQEKTMLRQYKSHKGTIKILEEKIRTWEKERDEIMARGRLDPATQAKVDELNKAVSDAKAATKKKQKALIDQNNHLITEKWAIQKEGRRLTNDEKARLKEINQRISANNDEINGSSYDLSQLIRNAEEQKKAMRGDVKMNFADSTRLSQINRRLEADRAKLNRMENELVRITGEKGYARMMKDQRTLMENLVSGRTAEDLEDTVTAMQENLDTVTKEMAERADNLKKLASAEAVLKIRQMFDNRGLKRIAAKLKADVGSELENTEIENRLALIALKMKEGKYDAENAEELADLLAGRIKREMTGYYIPALRGSTIVLGDVQMKELKGTHRTLADIRAQLAGTGIRISDKGSTSLDSKWEELCKEFPSLDPKERVGNQLDALLEKILDEKAEQETVYNNEDLMNINTKLLEAAQELIPEIITDENSLRLIRESMAFVTRVSGAAKNNAAALEEINNMISRLQKKGEKAVKTAKKLTGDISETIDYFDQLSLQSEAAMWKEERLALIDQLKSENTKNLMEEAARWRERIEKDKSYREIAAENLQTRKRITTNVSRVRKLLINETDLKNIPEHMKGLAREMLTRIVDNDLGMRKITGIDKKDLAETKRVLTEMRKLDGDFMPDDLKMMADEEAQYAVFDAMADLEEGLQEYNSQRTGDMMKKAEAVKATLDKISDAVSAITSIINAERNVSYLDRVVPIGYAAGKIRADMNNSRHKGEWKGTGSKAVEAVKRSVVYGNETPEYFIDGLRNRGMDELWDDARQAENRNGLEAQKAQDRLAQLAQETNFKAWANEKHDVVLGGKKRTITIGNMMELYAIWKREKTSNPEMSEHLNKGGVFFEEQETGGKLRREVVEQRAIRITDGEIIAMYNNMTENQKKLIEGIVRYLSDDMSRLGNEASMRMYGIRKYKELYYFPMKVWDGVKSARSDKGITGTNENRMAHYSFSKRRQNMARNALVIGDFMTDAVNHIVEMINYNTMAPAIENINKVLNYKFTEEAGTDNETQRNMRVLFQQAYGKDALNYLETLLKDMNGGVTQDQRKTLRDRALTMFKKNAVAGSLSVALQQPLSYIRASMMISPKYLAPAPVTSNWKNSYKEMMQYSGIAVIKKMGRFDMNFGQSAKDYIMPETKQSLYNRTSDVLTKAPELMDAMTWTWMWAATKAETAAKNPGMDTTSNAFLNLTANRFNEVMRKTQVYDSVLVKSSNMRSNNLGMKVLTSFMAEPTLTLNMLADAVRNVGAEGGKTKLIKAFSTFFLSAIFQAGVKGLMGSGRTPDKKKTWLENFMNKFQYNLINEGNMFSLIPGYSDLIEVLKTGELQDDAMGAIGKLSSIVDTLRKAAQGNGKSAWRDVEDTVGQFAQLFTNIPAKNLMRDARAIYNWIAGSEYADRPTSGAVIKYQTEANWFSGDNVLGTINTWLGEAGFLTSNKRYYSRIYDAMKKGDKETEKGIKEYLSLAKGVKDDTINTGIKTAAKSDTSMTEAQKDAWMIKNNLLGEKNVSTITTQYKEGKISAAEARKLWKELDPKLTDNDLYWKQDRADYQKETGADSVSGYSYRLHDAIAENKGESIRKAIKNMLDHGVKKESIKSAITEKWKEIYLNADSRTRTAIRDAIQKAYKAIGLTAQDANKVIDNWKKKK